MIIIMNSSASQEQIDTVVKLIRQSGLSEHISRGTERTIVGAVGNERLLTLSIFETLPGVERALNVVKEYSIVSRESQEKNSIVSVRGIEFGGKQIQVIAGPCSVETEEQMYLSAEGAYSSGCRLMRGGAFKPRTSPYAFQGLGVVGLEYLQKSASKHNLPVVTELMDVRMLDVFLAHDVDVIQIGARNMQNFDLLKEVGRVNKPVILKRGLSATIKEWLMSAEYIAAGGNHQIIFCERGIRSFESAYRNVLDLTAVTMLKRETHLPVIVDPSHASGKAWMVDSLAKAAVAVGADGLMIEMHPKPCEAWCDADQALTPIQLNKLMQELNSVALAIGRTLL